MPDDFERHLKGAIRRHRKGDSRIKWEWHVHARRVASIGASVHDAVTVDRDGIQLRWRWGDAWAAGITQNQTQRDAPVVGKGRRHLLLLPADVALDQGDDIGIQRAAEL